jgi:hypothetical protein
MLEPGHIGPNLGSATHQFLFTHNDFQRPYGYLFSGDAPVPAKA